MNISKVISTVQNANNANSALKIIKNGSKTINIDDLENGYSNFSTILELPNAKRASNMLDAFIAATGTVVEDYNPNHVVDFLA